MPTKFHLIMGEKGGVGKSEVALALVDYYTQRGQQIVVCEADRSNGETGPAVEGKNGHTVIYLYFSENAAQTKGADELLDASINNGVATIIDCPAQSLRPIAKWIADGSIDIALEDGIEPHFWFVTNGQRSSMGLLLESVSTFPTIPHILIRNHFMIQDLTYDYSDPESNPEVATILAEHEIPVLNFPCFQTRDIEYRKAEKLTFLEAIEDRPGAQRATRSRIRSRLKEFFSELAPLPLFMSSPASASSSKSPVQTEKKDEPNNTATYSIESDSENLADSAATEPSSKSKTKTTRGASSGKKRERKSKNLADSSKN